MKQIDLTTTVKIIKKLGVGTFGTTYLVLYNGKRYALKVQHILPKDVKKSFKSSVWREIDLYESISRMPKANQLFFTRLHSYEICDDCDHRQIRPTKINTKDKFGKSVKELDKSKLCIKYLLDYKGNNTLYNFLVKKRLTKKLVYSICLQICNIILILYKKGYSHGDIHPKNIMISKTKRRNFIFQNKKIAYEGIQLSSIDYGEVIHKKFHVRDRLGNQVTINKQRLFRETFYSIIDIILGIPRRIEDCIKAKKKLPWERSTNTSYDIIKRLVKNHLDFLREEKKKYSRFNSVKYIDNVISKITKKQSIEHLLNDENFWDIMSRILIDFSLHYPHKYTRYIKWCSNVKPLLSTDTIQNLLLQRNYGELTKYLINQRC